jgi:hypothetical protein
LKSGQKTKYDESVTKEAKNGPATDFQAHHSTRRGKVMRDKKIIFQAANRPLGAGGEVVIGLADTLTFEARRTRGRYVGSLRDLAQWTANHSDDATARVTLTEELDACLDMLVACEVAP